jgi:hypothetical protein
MADNPFEIPQTLRDLSEQNLKQAHDAYEQLAGFVTKAMDAWKGVIPANPMTAGFKDVQDRAMEIAMENAESAFAFAGKICNAPTPQDIGTLQTQFAQDRMKSFMTQTQQLFSLMGEALQKSEPGARATSTDAAPPNLIPSNLMTAGHRSVQDRAVAMAKNNAESSFALVKKIASAQTFQELSTLQLRFVQEQMQAYTAQMQELQGLIGAAIQKSEPS